MITHENNPVFGKAGFNHSLLLILMGASPMDEHTQPHILRPCSSSFACDLIGESFSSCGESDAAAVTFIQDVESSRFACMTVILDGGHLCLNLDPTPGGSDQRLWGKVQTDMIQQSLGLSTTRRRASSPEL